ncbi:hypothetical protein ABPG74_013649 [Tetrahymena malaccensis]
MFRYLYKDKNPLAGLVKRQYMYYKWEQQGYIQALLARTRINNLNGIQDPIDKAYEEVNFLEIDEHYQLAKSDHVEQVYKQLNALNKLTLGESDIILNKKYEELSKITQIIDPDKFPIFSLIETIDTHELVSIWDYKSKDLLPKIKKQLGFTLQVKDSTLEHHSAGEGVFLNCADGVSVIPTGSFLGFLGGVVYDSLTDYNNSNSSDKLPDTYIHRFDNTVVDFAQKIPYPYIYGNSIKDYIFLMSQRKESEKVHIKEVPSNFINPFSVGHKINHPPKFSSPNVIFLDIYIPMHFFSESFMKFFPFIRADSPKQSSFISKKNKIDLNVDHFHGIGIFALRDIYDGEELFVDYFDCNFYDVENTPDWLIRPPPLDPQYTKQEFEYGFSMLAKLIDRFILSKQLSVYEQFARKVSHDPSKEDLQEKTKLLQNYPKQLKKYLSNYENDGVEEGYFAKKIQQKQKQQNQNKD